MKKFFTFIAAVLSAGSMMADLVATPVISGSTEFTDSVIVTMSCATADADIYYSIDGTTDPKCDCAQAPEYKKAIVIKETTTIMAAAYTGNDWSDVAEVTFTKVEALSVAQAYEIGMALDSAATSEVGYTVEGYVINPGSFSMLYMNQSWYMADDAAATESDFQAYNCYPIQGADTLKVLHGDKVSVSGKLKKYWNKNANKFIIEFEKANATFVEMTPGDHSVINVVEEVTVAEALALAANLADNTSTEKQYKITGYVSAINVKSSDAYSDQYGNQSFWVADEQGSTAQTNADGAFYVYRGKPNTGEAIPYGALVEFTCTLKKYVPSGGGDPVIENSDQNIIVTVLEVPEIAYDTIGVATAVEIALALEDNKSTAESYVVAGYVAKVYEEYSSKYKNVSFYMTDDASNTFGDLQCRRAKVADNDSTLAAGDFVLILGKLTNNYYEEKNTAQIYQGEASVMWKQAIENIIVNDPRINKIIVDGVVYIVREGKIYNMQGIEVR